MAASGPSAPMSWTAPASNCCCPHAGKQSRTRFSPTCTKRHAWRSTALWPPIPSRVPPLPTGHGRATPASTLRPPPQVLRPWRPGIADIDDWREPPKPAPAGHDALVMACDPEPPEAQALCRAAERAGVADRLFETDKRLEGYGWYDRLDRVTGVDTEITADGKTWPLHDFPVPERTGAPAAPLPTRPAAIRMALAVKTGGGRSPHTRSPRRSRLRGRGLELGRLRRCRW